MRRTLTRALTLVIAIIAGLSLSGPPAMAAGPADNQYLCNQPWVPVAQEPGGYIIGNCKQNVLLYRSFLSSPVTNNEGTYTYHGGYVNGNYQGCGWIRFDRGSYQGIRGRTNCTDTASTAPASVAYYANCRPGTCQDGSPVTVAQNCPSFYNVRPWIPNGNAYDFFYSNTGGARTLLWRYVTADNRFVMVHDPSPPAGQGAWFFVPGACVNSAEFTTRNPYTVYWYH